MENEKVEIVRVPGTYIIDGKWYTLPRDENKLKEDQMITENKSTGVWIPEENTIRVEIESVDIKEPDPIKVGDEVEYRGMLGLEHEGKIGIVEEIRDNLYSLHYGRELKEYKINGIWFSDLWWIVKKKVDEKDIAWGTVEEVINGGMNTVNEGHSWGANVKASVIDEALAFNKDLEKGAMRQTVEEVTEEDKAKWKELTDKKHRTTIEEDMMNFLIED